jgi:tetratricopeptide (TPR) repeat protein
MAEVTSPEVQKYSTLVKLQPENPEAHFRLGFAHEDAGNTAEAVKHYETAIKLQPRHAMSYLHRGFLFAKGGELQLALQEWARAFEYDPYLHNKFSSPELRPIYKAKFDTAIQQLERPIVINPKDAFARYQLGTAYKYFQKPELALQSLKRALDINPDLWEAHYQCGEIFAQLNQNKLAITSFQRAIDGNSRYADSHYELGLIYEKENMSALALRHVERAMELDPEVSKFHFALGRIFMKQTKYKRAMKQYQKALDLDPADARIHLRLAECCKQMYRPDLAIHCYEKAVELDPESSEAVYELGTTALQLGDIDRAILGFRKALEINPQDAYAHYSLAQAYHRQKDFEAAATHYGESARLNPKDAFAAYNLGLMKDALNQPQQAIEAYRKAVELKPHDAQYHLNLGRSYLNAKRPQEAANELKQAIKLNPNDLETNFFLADVHMEQGQYDEAISLYRKVVELNPSSVEARFRMAEAFQTLDMPDYAFEAFQETVRLDPRHFQALHGLGHIYLTSRKKPSIAVDFFQQALDVEPSHAASMVSLGDAYMQLGQPDRALQFFERKLEENRENTVFIGKYCLALADSGHATKAAEEVRVALQLNPESVELRRTHAELLSKQGRKQDALDAWSTAVRLDDKDPQSIFGYAKALLELGREDEAKANLQRVLSLDPHHKDASDQLAALMPYDPATAAAVPAAAPVSAEPESSDPFDFISASAAPVVQEPISAPSEDPFAAHTPTESTAPTPQETPVSATPEVDNPFGSTSEPVDSASAADDPFSSTPEPAGADNPFAAAEPAPAVEPAAVEPDGPTDDPFAAVEPAAVEPDAPADDPFAAVEPAAVETDAPADDPFAAVEPAAVEPDAPSDDPFAAVETDAPADDPFTAVEPAAVETDAPADDPFAAVEPAAGEADAPTDDPFAAVEPAAGEADAPTDDPFAAVETEDPPAAAATEEPVAAAETETPVAEEPETEAPPVDPDFSAEEVLQQAILANVTGQTDEALSLFESIMTKAPDYAPVYFHYGQVIRGQGDEAKATEVLQTGLAKAQEQGAAELVAQFNAELTPSEPAAEVEATPPAEQETSQPSLSEQLAALESENSFDAAAVLWENSEEKPVDSGQRIFFAWADAQLAAGEPAAAIATLERFLTHQAGHEDTLNKIVELEAGQANKLAAEAKFSEAVQLLQARLSSVPDNVALTEALTGVQRQQRDAGLSEGSDEGLALARTLSAQSDEDKQAYLDAVKGKAETLAGTDVEQAVALIDSELGQDGIPDGLNQIAAAILMQKATEAKAADDVDKAKELAQKVLDRVTDHPEATALVNEAPAEVSEWKKAEESGDLAAAVSSIPDDADHEADRHRLYAALVTKLRDEGSLPDAIGHSTTWLEKVGEDKHDEVKGVRLELYKKQIEGASGEELLSAVDALKAAGAEASDWSALVLTTAQARKADNPADCKNLLKKLEADSLDEQAKSGALELWLELGKTALEAGEMDAADESLEQARTLGSSDGIEALSNDLVVKRAETAIQAGEFATAVSALNDSTLADEVKNPLLIAALQGQAVAAKDGGDADKAGELFSQLKELDPENAAAAAFLAEASADSGAGDGGAGEPVVAMELPESPDEAIDILKEKLAEDPKNRAALKAAYERFGTKANARKLIDLFRELQKKNSENADYLLALARAYSHVGKDTLAVVQFRKLLSNDPQPEVYLDLTRAYRRLKKMADASKTLEQALEAMPGDAGPKREQVVILSLSDEHSAAEAAAKEGLTLAGLSDEDKTWFETAASVAGGGDVLSEEMQEIPSRF